MENLNINIIIGLAIGWAVPYFCLALVNHFKSRWKKGSNAEAKEEWEAHASELTKRVERLEEEMHQKDREMEAKIDSMLETLDALRKAMLNSHLRELIIDGKTYLGNNEITLNQLGDYEERYQTYLELGGPPEPVEPWVTQIRRLPKVTGAPNPQR